MIQKYRIKMELMNPITFDDNGKSSTHMYQNTLTEKEMKMVEDG